jgi:putative component of membrane protein insertase Oxa1/YidC/SpoIIIJ protein YidD
VVGLDGMCAGFGVTTGMLVVIRVALCGPCFGGGTGSRGGGAKNSLD